MRLLSCYITIFIISIIQTTLWAQTFVDGNIVSETSTGGINAGNDYISLYQKHISSLKNGTCPMYPSCSNYGLHVYSDKNFFQATALLCDRLIRCSHDREQYQTTYEYGYKSYIDYPHYKEEPNKLRYKKSQPHAPILKTEKDSVIPFINYLINESEFSAALLEIERINFSRKSTSKDLLTKKLQCYRGLGRYEKAIFEYNVNFPKEYLSDNDIKFEIAQIQYLLKDYKSSLKSFENIDYSCSDINASELYNLKALVNIREGNIEEALSIYNTLAKIEPDNYNATKNRELLHELATSKKKSPTLARLLSIIPGAGYLYAGHKGSAITSFIINSLLAYATYTSIKNDNYGVAGIVGFVSFSFYLGNISGAGRSAKRYNENKRESIISRIERTNHIINH